MNRELVSLHQYLEELNEEFGGEVGFIPPIEEKYIEELETKIQWHLPKIFRYFLTNESNGLIIGNKVILSVLNSLQKKTLVENIERNNNPEKSPWFKTRPHIFNDYLVIGSDLDICFCYSKKYDLTNPAIYICENANSSKGVDFDRLDFGLEGLIRTMVSNEFE